MPTTAKNRKSAVNSDYAPLYAVAGLADAALQTVRTTMAHRIADARARSAQLADRAGATRVLVRSNAEDAIKLAGELPGQILALPDQLRALPETARTQLASAQRVTESLYADIAGRGKEAVDGAVLQARRLQAQAAAQAAKVADEAAGRLAEATAAADEAADRAKASTRSARSTANGRAGGTAAAAKNATGKSAAGKSAAGQTAAAKKAAAQSAAANSAAARKSTTPSRSARTSGR